MKQANKRINPKLLNLSRSIRKKQTPAETLLWSLLRNRELNGLKFRRQYPVGNYILDFYCPEKKLAIEVDGGQHMVNKQQDQTRTLALEKRGIKVIRFTNDEVLTNIESVLDVINNTCQER